MSIINFEEQLKDYVGNLHPLAMKLFYPKGEKQIEYRARGLNALIESNINLKKLLEIYDYQSIMLAMENPAFPYDAFLKTTNKYGNELDRYDIVLLISFIVVGQPNEEDHFISNEKIKNINSYSIKLLKTFGNIERNTCGNEMLGAFGEFGYEITNPIPVHGFSGIEKYFNGLCSSDGQEFTYTRIGSSSTSNIKEFVDSYTISFIDKRDKTLYMSIYNTSNSKKTPDGFVLKNNLNRTDDSINIINPYTGNEGIIAIGQEARLKQILTTNGIIKLSEVRPSQFENELLFGEYKDAIMEVYIKLGGIEEEYAYRGRWDIISEGYIIELDEQLHFNQYRLETLESSLYKDLIKFPLAVYRNYCIEFSGNCLRVGSHGGKWSSDAAERMFGPSENPGDLTGSGSARWKQRAFYDFVKDISTFITNIPFVRLSTYDDIDYQGQKHKLGDLLKNDFISSKDAATGIQKIINERWY